MQHPNKKQTNQSTTTDLHISMMLIALVGVPMFDLFWEGIRFESRQLYLQSRRDLMIPRISA
jgi:hypothetical protein